MFCMHCGKELWENARFCQACGTPVGEAQPVPPVAAPAPVATPVVSDEKALFEEERALVACCHGSINRERLAWKSLGVVWLVLSVLLLVAAVVMVVFAQQEAVIHPDYVWGGAFLSLFVSVVNFRMTKKTAVLCASIYTDIRPIVDRYSGNAPVVFSAVFNLIAMLFVIEMAGKIKSQTAVLERIVKRQQTPRI